MKTEDRWYKIRDLSPPSIPIVQEAQLQEVTGHKHALNNDEKNHTVVLLNEAAREREGEEHLDKLLEVKDAVSTQGYKYDDGALVLSSRETKS